MLTYSDIHSGYLVLPWDGFCKDSLPNYETALTVVDYVGFYWRCCLEFGRQDNVLICMIGGEWGDMCKARNFVQGRSLKLAIVSDKDNRVIYLRPLPRPSKHGDRLTLVTKVMSEKSGDALYRIAGTTVSVEVARSRRDLLKLNLYDVEFELSTKKGRLPAYFSRLPCLLLQRLEKVLQATVSLIQGYAGHDLQEQVQLEVHYAVRRGR